MTDTSGISSYAVKTLERAVSAAQDAGQEVPGLSQWLLVVLGDYAPMAATLTRDYDAFAALADARRRVSERDFGEPLDPQTVADRVRARARTRGGDEGAPKDLLAVVLEAAGVTVAPEVVTPTTVTPADETNRHEADLEASGGQPAGAETLEEAVAPEPISTKPTPTIDRFGRDLTAEARAGKLQPLYGRDQEVQTIVEVLCRSQKRNPLLIGPAGSGKTAIVEGFAQRIFGGDVPDFLKGVRVLAVETSALMSGTGVVGTFEERIRAVLDEAAQPGVVLFLDEAHTMMEAGGRGGGFADSLKPALARGEVALIAATTDDEYRRFIKPDSALERRFQPVVITEMTAEQALEVLKIRRDHLVSRRGVAVDDAILCDLVDFAEENMRNRTFPDKAIDLLEQCVAHAVSRNELVVSTGDATTVTARMLGATVAPAAALEALSAEFERLGVAESDAAKRMISRLTTTLNGLDYRAWRPNLVAALVLDAVRQTGLLARTLAAAIYGSDERVLTIDLSSMRDDESLSALIGPPPGYIGYGRPLPIHQLGLTPRTVVIFQGIDRCHAVVADVVATALAQGSIADTQGDRYYLSDATVLLPLSTATTRSASHIGFDTKATHAEDRSSWTPEDLEEFIGTGLAGQVDLVVSEFSGAEASTSEAWMRSTLLPGVAQRYGRKGIDISWDDAVVAFLVEQASRLSDLREVESFTEEKISHAVLKGVEPPHLGETRHVRLVMKGDGFVAKEQPAKKEPKPAE